jgi:hypothetical protein
LDKRLRVLILLALGLTCFEGADAWAPAQAQSVLQPTKSPRVFLGRRRPGKVVSLSEDGVTVDLKKEGMQLVQFAGIWRIRRAFVSGEPRGSTVIDFADNRLFVVTPVADLVDEVGKKIALVRFTTPNGKTVYMAAGKITDVSTALPGLHNPASRTVMGTRYGAQQITEPVNDAKRMLASAHPAPAAEGGDVADRR